MAASCALDNFARFIFCENDGRPVDIHIHGLDTSRDLFKLCLDLLCKGLFLLYGKDKGGDKGVLCLDDITLDDFDVVQQKLKHAGIRCILETYQLEECSEDTLDLWTQNFLNLQAMDAQDPSKLQLSDYIFELQTATHIYKIKFEVFHSVPDAPKRVVL
jgi:hypothetical protein